MTFEQALNDGHLDVARALLDELVELPDTGGLGMPECYADLAREFDRKGATTTRSRYTSVRSSSVVTRFRTLDQTSLSFTFAPGARNKRPRSGPS